MEGNSYVETFLQEAKSLLEEVEQIILEIEDNPDDLSAVDRLFRAMHTIKGSGAMFGFDDIAAFTHHIETALDMVRNGSLRVSKELIDLILAGRDQIQLMLDNEAVDISESGRIIHAIQVLSGTTPSGDGTAAAHGEPEAPRINTYRIRFEPEPGLLQRGMDPARIIEEVKQLGECDLEAYTERIPGLSELDPEACLIYWDIILRTEQEMDDVRDVFLFVSDRSKVQISRLEDHDPDDEDAVPRLGDILVEKGDIRPEDISSAVGKQKKIGEILVENGVTSRERVDAALKEQKLLSRHMKTGVIGSVRVPFDKLDNLVNLVGELVTNQARLNQVAGRIEDTDLSSTAEDVERLTSALRDSVLNIRMMPIGNIFSKFRRLVRDLSDELGKEIDLVTEGGDAELDKTVLEKLDEPLVHLIRNSIDHGIDPVDRRLELGKPRRGTIRLAAVHKGATVAIIVEDDGRGLNKEKILQQARSKGLIRESEVLPESEIFSLIFEPGFSTSEVVTSVSGRGVGMDAVKKTIDALRGSVHIASTPGKGTTITLSLPLTLAIIDGFLVESGGDRFIFPLSVVTGCLEFSKADREETGGKRVMTVRGHQMPYVRIREEFNIPGEIPDLEHVVTAEMEGEQIGLAVDRIVGDHQAVIKSLGGLYDNVEGVSGATIMGDGKVALIVDIPSLIKRARMDQKLVFEERQK